MSTTKYHLIPARDPIAGGELYISELTSDESKIVIRGRFSLPKFATLDAEQTRFMEAFLRCRGMLNGVEKELGISYPTVRARLDSLLAALGIEPVKERERKERPSERKTKILDELERGEITPEEAKAKLREEAKK